MTRAVWDSVGEHLYETGVDRGVLYQVNTSTGEFEDGVVWNGLTTVTESPSGAAATAQWADNIKYLNLYSYEEFGGTIEAFTYPDEFGQNDGTASPEPGVNIGQQTRKAFGFAYRTRVGNDLEAQDFGYKLHLIYNATASPSEKAYETIGDTPSPINFSWEFATLPVAITDYKPTSYICIDSTKVDADALAALEDMLYGTVSDDPRLPSPDEVLGLFAGTITSVTPGTPTYDSGTDLVTIPGTVGVVYKLNGVVTTAGTHAITANAVVDAKPAVGYKFPTGAQDKWWFTFA
jgi:hypothetical protein